MRADGEFNEVAAMECVGWPHMSLQRPALKREATCAETALFQVFLEIDFVLEFAAALFQVFLEIDFVLEFATL